MAGLSRDEIWAAADAIAREGRLPRVADVHKGLGRGSYTTITDAMRDWREANKPAAATAPETAPEAISGRLTALGNELWALARQTAQAELQKEREALDEVKVSMHDQQRETAELADALAEDNEQLKLRLSELARDLTVERSRAADLLDKLHEAQKSLAAMEGARQSVADHLRSVQDDNSSLREMLAEREAERDQLVQSERQRTQEVTDLRADVSKIQAELQAAKDLRDLTAKAVDEYRDGASAERKRADAETQRARDAESRAAELAGELKALREAAAAAVVSDKDKKQGGTK